MTTIRISALAVPWQGAEEGSEQADALVRVASDRRRQRRQGAASALILVVTAACTNFPREDQIQDLRVLAVRTEPAEVLYSPLLALGGLGAGHPGAITLPPIDIAVEVFAFDPRGGDVTTSIRMCREDSADEACREQKASAVLDDVDAADRAAAALVVNGKTLDATIDTSVDKAGLVPDDPQTFTLPSSLVAALLPRGTTGAPQLSITSAQPRFIVDVKNPKATAPITEERAVKRIPFTPNLGDPLLPAAVTQPLLAAFNTKLCTAEQLAQPPIVGTADCFRPVVANQNPELLGFVFNIDPVPDNGMFLDVGPDVGPVSTVKAVPGSEQEIDPVFPSTALEPYQSFVADLQTGVVTLQNRVEDFAVEWYATDGDVGEQTTSTQSGGLAIVTGQTKAQRLGTTWLAPASKKSGDRDTIVIVVHDQRGGIAVGRIEVEY